MAAKVPDEQGSFPEWSAAGTKNAAVRACLRSPLPIMSGRGDTNMMYPEGSMYPNSMYFGLKVLPI